MKRLFVFMLLVLIATPVLAETCKVETGFGYFKDAAGHIVSKARLSKGTHPIKEDFTYHEVGSKEELSEIDIHEPEPTDEEQVERLIRDKISKMNREKAIAELKTEDKLKETTDKKLKPAK